MTTKERIELQNLFNRISVARERKDKAFKELQELNASLGNARWCSAITNFEEIIKTTNDSRIKTMAEMLFIDFIELNAIEDTLEDLGGVLLKLGFLKKN